MSPASANVQEVGVFALHLACIPDMECIRNPANKMPSELQLHAMIYPYSMFTGTYSTSF